MDLPGSAPLKYEGYTKERKHYNYGHFFFFFSFFGLFRAAPAAYGSSQARGGIGAVAAGLHQSHSNEDLSLILQPTP